ncbi:MAG: enoyl-CoA hydratase/isomerase family protein, partial [Amylibacter sp.]
MVVSIRRNGKIGHVEINNLPVNAIGLAVRQGLLKAVEWIARQKGLERVVLSGAGKVFCAGGDAREFDSAPQEPHLPDILQLIEASKIPWVAAAHGTALGGGAELMLACRYRVATPDVMIGLPEVTLGVVPGAGGTQRLPRLIGLKAALDMIATGKAVNAEAAADIGFLDAVADDPVDHAINVDLDVVVNSSRVSEMPAPTADIDALDAVKKTVRKRMRDQIAPLIAIDLVKQTVDQTFADGLHDERKAFLSLRGSDQAKALRYIFFAERAARTPEWLCDTTFQPVS